jgi:membrane protein YqaA with SNARE-associated domain
MDWVSLGYVGLFLSGFLSATILPMNSEAVLLVLLAKNFDPYFCLLVATVGNTLGGYTNYWLGILGNPIWFKRFGIQEDKLKSFENKVQRYGYWLAFFSWVPFIGDPLAIALGFFRVSLWRVALLILLGKFLRYLALVVWF